MNKNVAVALSLMLAAIALPASGSTVVDPAVGGGATQFTRTYTWEITKTADVGQITLAPGDSKIINYTVHVVQIVTDSVPGAIGDPTTVVGYEVVNVVDSLAGALGTASNTAWYTYQYTVNGSSDSPSSWSVINTATIYETGQTAGAEVLITMLRTVPEPGTLALLGLGLAGLGMSRRRR